MPYMLALVTLAAPPTAPLASTESGRSVDVRMRKDIAWTALQRVQVLPTQFELDPAFHRRSYDTRARRAVDSTLTAADRKHLSSSIGSALRRTTCKTRVADADAKAVVGTLFVEPVVVKAGWTRPPARAFNSNVLVDAKSVRAGGAEVRLNAYVVRNGERELVAVVVDRWWAQFGDQLARVDVWQDADHAFQVIGKRFRKHLRRFGFACP